MKIRWGILSKYKNELYGMAILWIMLLHGLVRDTHGILGPKFRDLTPILTHGNCGVDVFLFLSGIFLYFSFSKNHNIKFFFLKRFFRIFIPFIFITGSYWIYDNIICNHSIILFIKNITFYSFWFGKVHFAWFIGAIALFYVLYPLIYKIIYSTKLNNNSIFIFLMICVIYISCYFFNHSGYFHAWYSNVEIALTRLPVFILGCHIGKSVYENRQINPFLLLISFFLILFGIYLFYHHYPIVPNYRILYFFVAPCLAIWFAVLLELFSNKYFNWIFAKLGILSLELYLLQMALQNLTLKFNFYSDNKVEVYHTYLIYCVIGAIIIAAIIHPLLDKIRMFIIKNIPIK